MKEIYKTTLLREKFVITEAGSTNADVSMVALSNRLFVDLKTPNGSNRETFIVRAQNMHMCVRFAAKMFASYADKGPLMNRPQPFKWVDTLIATMSDYERTHNEDFWLCVYSSKGRPVFTYGEHHPFLDVIEQCDAFNSGVDSDSSSVSASASYTESIKLAEQSFQQAGKNVEIYHDSNVALNLDFELNQAKIGVIIRAADKTTTFQYTVLSKDAEQPLNIPQVMNASAAFLEGFQVAFMVGMGVKKKSMKNMEVDAMHERKINDGKERLRRLDDEIETLENTFLVNYRPEKPHFGDTIREAHALAASLLSK